MTELHEDETPNTMHPLAQRLFGWVGSPRTPQIFFWGLLGLSIILVIAELSVDRHAEGEIEGLFGFYGLWGFVSFFGVVMAGWPLGRLLRRREDYYGDTDPDGFQTREDL